MSETPPYAVDLTIIGGGPVGLFGAYYAGLRKMSVRIIDALEMLGGQLSALYPEKYIYDVAGFPKILAKDLVKNLVDQAMQNSPQICLGEQARTLEQSSTPGLMKITTNQATHYTRTILIAGGMGAFAPKKLTLPNAADYEDKGLYYFLREPAKLANKRVLIVGGGDSAVDWANMLCGSASEVTLIHRRDEFRAHEESVEKMCNSTVRVIRWHELKSIHGDGRIQKAVIYDNRSHETQEVHVDAVLVSFGFQSSLGHLATWGLNLEKGQICVDYRMQTNIPGVFASGDIAQYPGKLKLIATGFGEAVTAVCNAKVMIDPKSKLFPGHSSDMKH